MYSIESIEILVVRSDDVPKLFRPFQSDCSIFWVSSAWGSRNLRLTANMTNRVFRAVSEQGVLTTWLV